MDFRTLAEIWFEQNEQNMCYTYFKALKSLIKYANIQFGSKAITEIKPIEISSLINSLAKKNPHTGKPTAKKSLQTLILTLYRMFDLAIDNDWLIKNPAKNKNKMIPKNAPRKSVTAISKSDQLAIMETPHRCQIAALIMMLMGLRTGELLALEWSDIDLINKKAYIHRHAVKIASNEFVSAEGTKTGSARYVTIPDNLCDYLSFAKRNAVSKYVFPKEDGKINTPSSWKSAWRGYINTLNFAQYAKNHTASKFNPNGYPKTIKINPQQLRHTYATLLYISKVDVLTASKLLGHSSAEITLDIYTHLDEKFKTLDISNFNEYLSSDLCKI